MTRIRPIAVLAAASLGLLGAAPIPTPATGKTLSVGVNCYALGRGRLQCEALVDNGTSPYTFSWTPTPTAGGFGDGLAIVPCTQWQYQTVSVTVTDAESDTGSASGSFYCGNPV
jgi:hypothetical protein